MSKYKGDREQYKSKGATALSKAFLEKNVQLRSQGCKPQMCSRSDDNVTEILVKTTGARLIHYSDRDKNTGVVRDIVVAVGEEEKSIDSWDVLMDQDRYPIRVQLQSQPGDMGVLEQSRDAIDQIYQRVAVIPLTNPKTPAKQEAEDYLPPAPEQVRVESNKDCIPEEEVILLEDVVDDDDMDDGIIIDEAPVEYRQMQKELSEERNNSYLANRPLIEEKIGNGGIERKINLLNIGNCRQPGKKDNYDDQYMETAMMTVLARFFDELVEEEYDSFVMLAYGRAFDLGSREMLKGHDEVSYEKLTMDQRLELLQRLEGTIGERTDLDTKFKQNLQRGMLESGQQHLSALNYIQEHAHEIFMYEFNKPTAKGLLRHLIKGKGTVLVAAYNSAAITELSEALIDGKGAITFSDAVDIVKCSVTTDQQTVQFIGSAAQKAFREYAGSKAVAEKHMIADMVLETMIQADEKKEAEQEARKAKVIPIFRRAANNDK